MLLERIDIDARGPFELVQLGPFSHRLNAILGPVASVGPQPVGTSAGRTCLPVIPFLRDLMLGSRRPLRDGGWSGRVVWADAEGLLHCRREIDGTFEGRLAVDFEPREPARPRRGRELHSSDYLRWRLSQLPPSIIEAVIAEAEDGFLSTLRAAHRCGLDSVAETPALQAEQREALVRLQHQATDLDRRIDALAIGDQTIGQLHDRRDQLQAELASLEDVHHSHVEQQQAEQTHRQRLADRLQELRGEAERLSDQESELRRSLTDIEASLRTITFDPMMDQPRYAIAETHRRQLEDLDSQLIRWRRTLREIRGIRDHLGRNPFVQGEAAAVRHVGPQQDWDARLDAAHRQIDWLTSRYAYGDLPGDGDGDLPHGDPWMGVRVAETSAGELAAQLRDIKAELNRACARVAHQQAADGPWSCEAAQAQLQRCETDLLGSIARLIRQRQHLLRGIARAHQVPVQQLAAAFGDWSHCQDHPHLYQWLLSDGGPSRIDDRETSDLRARRLEQDRVTCSHELDRTVNRLENCLSEIDSLRTQRTRLPLTERRRWHSERRTAVFASLERVRARLCELETRQQLIAQRDQCRHRLRQIRPAAGQESTLARRSSHWLTCLSGGRLQRLEWDASAADRETHGGHPEDARRADVRIDGRGAAVWTAAERSLATLALRMAAADALAQRGHNIPLLVETPANVQPLSDGRPSSRPPSSGPLTAQPVNHRDAWEVADPDLGRQRWDPAGHASAWIDTVIAYSESGRQTILLTENRRIADRVANAGGLVQSLQAHAYAVPRAIYSYRSPPPRAADGLLPQINRDLDMAWREAYGLYDAYTDGCTDGYTGLPGATDRGTDEAVASPFFLTTDSPVDQAPSVDAVAAARLRGLRLTRVGQLLAADPAALADALGMADVTAAAVRRWQHEAQLVCRVPQLRGFDARVLVGCGIIDPQHLAAMHPGQLLEKVEAFLATDRGRQILRSGSSYELTRITSWIAAANRSVARSSRHGHRHADNANRVRQTRTECGPSTAEAASLHGAAGRRRRRGSFDATRLAVDDPIAVRLAAEAATDREADADSVWTAGNSAPRAPGPDLDRQSPVVQAPSIGPRTAGRLQRIGVQTVDDLLRGDAAEIAARLGSKRIDARRVRQWQQQATLVCGIPMLRGHHAQLLVAAGIGQPEHLAGWDPDRLLTQIQKIARSAAGKRILCGSPPPELHELAAWIRDAQHPRSLRAA